jgi:hypothetical protein
MFENMFTPKVAPDPELDATPAAAKTAPQTQANSQGVSEEKPKDGHRLPPLSFEGLDALVKQAVQEGVAKQVDPLRAEIRRMTGKVMD